MSEGNYNTTSPASHRTAYYEDGAHTRRKRRLVPPGVVSLKIKIFTTRDITVWGSNMLNATVSRINLTENVLDIYSKS